MDMDQIWHGVVPFLLIVGAAAVIGLTAFVAAHITAAVLYRLRKGLWRWYSTNDKSRAVDTLAGIMFVVGAATLAGVVAAVGIGTGLHPTRWMGAATALVQGDHSMFDHFDPAATVGAMIVVLVLAAGLGWAGGWLWRHWLMPTGTGLMSRWEARRELSVAHCRRTARQTRPDLNSTRRAAADEVSLPVGQTPWRTDVRVPLESPIGVIAPARSGKTLMILAWLILAAPGALLTTSTKYDTLMLTACARERLRPGSVIVYDLTGKAPWPRKAYWNMTADATSVETADRYARNLMASSRAGASGKDMMWTELATDVLSCLLLAAGLSQPPFETFIRWCQNSTDSTPVQVLQQHPEFAEKARQLEAQQRTAPETRESIWLGVRRAIAVLTDKKVIDACVTGEGRPPFDAARWLANKGTVYVIADKQSAAQQAALVTAFVEHVLDAARSEAARLHAETGQDRLAPPLCAVLDEVTNICPIPSLPATMSDSAGRGIDITWSAQSKSQLIECWGPQGASGMIENTSAQILFGGITDEQLLRETVSLIGSRYETRTSRRRGGRGGNDVQLQPERRNAIEEDGIRTIPRQHALLLLQHLPPLIIRLTPLWESHLWKQLKEDETSLRTGAGALDLPNDEMTAS